MDAASDSFALPTDAGVLGDDLDEHRAELAELAELLARRDKGERYPAPAQPLQLSGLRFVETDLSGLDLSGSDLSYCEFVNCLLRGSRLVRTNFTGAMLHDADLAGAELLGAQLDGVDMSNANLARAGLLQASAVEGIFYGARCEGASFSGADLSRAEFRAAELVDANLADADLVDADFTSAILTKADLSASRLAGAILSDTSMRGARLRNVKDYVQADWIGADITDVDFTGAWDVRRHIQDVNYINEFRNNGSEILYYLWWVTSDCGRSLLRWALWSVLIAMLYAVGYTQVDIAWGANETALSPVYFSVVTFTTLGYGDVLPASAAAQVVVISEVILGYLSLGGLMSILSDKMARRAG